MNGIKLRGLGRCVPAQSVTNDDLAKTVDTSDAWITARTGIRSRRRCTEETHTELCVTAARRALAQAGITPATSAPALWPRFRRIPLCPPLPVCSSGSWECRRTRPALI